MLGRKGLKFQSFFSSLYVEEFTPYTLLEIVSGIKKVTIPSGIKNI